MAENRIDYNTLEATGKSYKEKSDEIMDIVSTLTSTVDDFQNGVQNETSKAFVTKYETEYKPALEKAAEALSSVSEFMTKYAAEIREMDIHIAHGISGS